MYIYNKKLKNVSSLQKKKKKKEHGRYLLWLSCNPKNKKKDALILVLSIIYFRSLRFHSSTLLSSVQSSVIHSECYLQGTVFARLTYQENYSVIPSNHISTYTRLFCSLIVFPSAIKCDRGGKKCRAEYERIEKDVADKL